MWTSLCFGAWWSWRLCDRDDLVKHFYQSGVRIRIIMNNHKQALNSIYNFHIFIHICIPLDSDPDADWYWPEKCLETDIMLPSPGRRCWKWLRARGGSWHVTRVASHSKNKPSEEAIQNTRTHMVIISFFIDISYNWQPLVGVSRMTRPKQLKTISGY